MQSVENICVAVLLNFMIVALGVAWILVRDSVKRTITREAARALLTRAMKHVRRTVNPRTVGTATALRGVPLRYAAA